MELSDVMRAIATRIDNDKAALGIGGASYPQLNHIPESPWVMVRQSPLQPSRVDKSRAGQQVVYASIDVMVLIVSDPLRPDDAARLDTVLHPILDMFDANATGGNVNYTFTGLLAESVDQIWNEASIRRTVLDYGEAGYCHALIITLDTVFKRKAVMP